MAKRRVETELTPEDLARAVHKVLDEQSKVAIVANMQRFDVERCLVELEKLGIVDLDLKQFMAAALTWKYLVLKKHEGALVSVEFTRRGKA